jgi:outer membrane receptor protein involved in Fe transport
MRTQLHRLAIAALAAFLSAPLTVLAQMAPAPSTAATKPAPADEETLTLSPFVVSTAKDTGYIAADTLNAGRLSTNLLMTPGSIDIFTRDLINDLGVFNIDEASAWLTNSRPLELGAIETNSMNPGALAQQDGGSNVNLRGLGSNPSTRNYFTSAATPKEYNVERVESSRGPNAILYGEGGPGGGVNYNTKRAQNRNFGALRFRLDDLGSKGASLDLNRKLTANLDARYNLSLLDKRYHLDRTVFKEIGNAVNAVYRPFERTSIMIDADVTRSTRPGLIMTYGEQYARWDHQPVVGKFTQTGAALTTLLAAKGLAAWTGSKRLTWTEGLGMMDFAGYTRTLGYGLPQPTEYEYGDAFFPSAVASAPGISALAPVSRSFNANPGDIDVTDRAKDFQVSIDHTFRNKFSLQLAGQYSDFSTAGGNYYFTTVYLDNLQNLPDGRLNPNYGKPYAQAHVGRAVDYTRDSKSARLVAAYPLKHPGGTTNLSAFLTHQEKSDVTIYTDLHIKEAGSTLPITDAASLIYVNRYFDNLTENLPDFRSLYQTVDVPVVDGRNRQKVQAYQLALSGSYFKDMLSVVAGFRRDGSELTSDNGVVATRDAQTGAFTQYTTDTRKGYNDTTVLGLVYFPIPYVGVYANHGEGFVIQTISNKRLDGSFSKANIVPAEERSAGLRFQFGGSSPVKVVGSVGYYKAEQTNSNRAVGVGNINVLWRDLGLFEGKSYAANYIETFIGDPFSTSTANAITSAQSLVGKGWEASFTANVGNSFRLTVNGALPETKQSDVAADYVAYVNKHLATWQALAANPANPARAADTTNVNQIVQTITGFQEGRSQERTYKYRYNFFGIYTFRQTALKGLRVGGGAQFYGRSQIGNDIGLPFNYVYAKTYHLVSAQLGYPFKLGKYRADVQLNIDNLLGYDKSIFNGLFVHTVNGRTTNIPSGFKSVWPRAARLTLTIPF